jgi:hypothetical protein
MQRNVKGFITLSKYLLRGSRHEKTEMPKQAGHDSVVPLASTQGGD